MHKPVQVQVCLLQKRLFQYWRWRSLHNCERSDLLHLSFLQFLGSVWSCETFSICSDALFINEAETVTDLFCLFLLFFFSTYGHELLCQTNWLIFKPVIKCFGCRLKQKYFELGQWKKIYIYIYILSKGDNNGIILFVLLHSNTHLAGKAGAAIAIRTFQDVYHKSLKTLYTRGEAPLQHRSPPVWLQRTQNK